MMVPKIIIFGNAHPNNTLGLLRSLGEKGIKSILLLEPCDLRFCCVRCSKYIEKMHCLSSVEDGLRVLRDEYWNETEKPIILNAGDPSMSLLDAHYDELKDHFFIFNARGEQGRINFFMDKSNQFPVAEKCGLNLIKTWRFEPRNTRSTRKDIDDVAFPCLIKGNNSTSSSKESMYVCKNREELLSRLPDEGDCLVQEYIDKDFELDITGFSYNHGDNVFIPAVVRKIRERITRQSDYIRLESVEAYPTLEVDKIKSFVREIGYEGIFSVEMLCRAGKFYFLEINMRNDGVGYIYTAAGINYPYLWVRYNCGGEINESDEMSRLKVPRTLMTPGDIDNLIKGQVGFGQWLVECLSARTHFVFNWRDIKPFLYSIYIPMRQAVMKCMRVFK